MEEVAGGSGNFFLDGVLWGTIGGIKCCRRYTEETEE